MKSKIWVVAAGDEDKDLVPHMLIEGKMFIGPAKVTGDLSGKLESDLKSISSLKPRVRSSLISFRDKAENGQIVVLRLGSVCFAVGAIKSGYQYDDKFSNVYSYWNDGKLSPSEKAWNLSHTREVNWYVLNDRDAIHYFRKGIYGNPLRFYKLGSSGKSVSKLAKRELDDYINSIGYDNKNADLVLSKIGTLAKGVNKYGFPV